MNRTSRRASAAVALACTALVLGSCSLDDPLSSGEEGRERARTSKDAKRSAKPARKAAKGSSSKPAAVWTCTWAPTMDDDWHNDALCTDGATTERPYLRGWDDFVEQSEIMEAARAWARQRNGG